MPEETKWIETGARPKSADYRVFPIPVHRLISYALKRNWLTLAPGLRSVGASPGGANMVVMKPDFWAIIGVGVVLLGVMLTGQVNVQADISGLHTEIGGLRAEMNNQRRELSAQIQDVRGSVSDLQNSVSDLRVSVSGLRDLVSSLRDSVSNLELSVADLENRVSLIEDILDNRLPASAGIDSVAAQG